MSICVTCLFFCCSACSVPVSVHARVLVFASVCFIDDIAAAAMVVPLLFDSTPQQPKHAPKDEELICVSCVALPHLYSDLYSRQLPSLSAQNSCQMWVKFDHVWRRDQSQGPRSLSACCSTYGEHRSATDKPRTCALSNNHHRY